MDDWPRKLGRIVKPVVNWPKPEENWAGQPVAFVSAQVGYPNTAGEIMWVGRTFQKSDPDDMSWSFEITQKQLDDVENPPENWSPGETFIKRKISMMEPPDPVENPYVRVQISDNEIDLDPSENGSLMEDVAVEVRADEAGRIRLGPLSLNVELENSKQVVEVTFQATDENGKELSQFQPVKFSWEDTDQEEPRFWSIFTSDSSIRAFYKYQVRVIVKGNLFTKGKEWIGPWQESSGNGPLMISVPTPEDEGVNVVREFDSGEFVSQPISGETDEAPPSGDTGAAPPSDGKRGKKREKEQPMETLDIKGYSYWPERSGSTGSPSPPSGKKSRSKPEYANGETSYWREN